MTDAQREQKIQDEFNAGRKWHKEDTGHDYSPEYAACMMDQARRHVEEEEQASWIVPAVAIAAALLICGVIWG